MPSTVHAAQPANHSHAVLRIFSRMRDVDRTGKREMVVSLIFLDLLMARVLGRLNSFLLVSGWSNR